MLLALQRGKNLTITTHALPQIYDLFQPKI